MQRIKDYEVGQKYSLTLAVKASDIKYTKGNKPYLMLELFDGADSVNANIWDWTRPTKPEKNDVVNVEGTITEWEGKKQLSVTFINPNKEVPLIAFAPTGDVDVEEYYNKLILLVGNITHDALRHITTDIIIENKDLLKLVPGANSIHHAYVAGTLHHIVDTTEKAIAIASCVPGANLDLCTAGAILHDIGKLWTYKIDGIVIDMTEEGKSMEHIAMGMMLLEKHKTEENASVIALLQHIIASHHGKREYGSPVTPQFLEAWIIHYADDIDAKANIILNLNKKAKPGAIYTDKEWALENRAMFTQAYVRNALKL